MIRVDVIPADVVFDDVFVTSGRVVEKVAVIKFLHHLGVVLSSIVPRIYE